MENDLIGSKEAAEILELSIPRVNQLKERLGGVVVGGSLVFSRKEVEKFKALSRPRGWKKGKKRK